MKFFTVGHPQGADPGFLGMHIKLAQPTDADAVRTFLEGLSEDSRWLRYHSTVPIVRSWMVNAVVRSDGERHEALLAWSEDRIIGIAEWGRVDPSEPTADVAIVVRDDCRRHGIARALLRRLVRNGRTHGIEEFSASVLSTNRPMISLLQGVAPERRTSFDGPTVQVRIPLRAS